MLRTRHEVAELFNVHVNTVDNWTRKGKLPVVYLSSRAKRYREEDLEQFINNSRIGGENLCKAAPKKWKVQL